MSPEKGQVASTQDWGIDSIAVDSSGRMLAFTVWLSLRGSLLANSQSVHQYKNISWYAVWDTTLRRQILQGPRLAQLAQRTVDRAVGWSNKRLVIIRHRLLEPGARYPEKGIAELSEVTTERVEVILVALDGQEDRVKSFICPQIFGQPMPSRADTGFLERFDLCREADHLLFAESRLAFRKVQLSLEGGRSRQTLAMDSARSKTLVHCARLSDGRSWVIAELPGLRCEQILDDCRRDDLWIVSRKMEIDNLYDFQLLHRRPSGVLHRVWHCDTGDEVREVKISPDGQIAAIRRFVGDNTEIRVIDLSRQGRTLWQFSVSDNLWRLLWSGDSRSILVWPKLGIKSTKGYRLHLADIRRKQVKPVGPGWRVPVRVAFHPDGRTLYVAADGRLWRLDIATGSIDVMWRFPVAWSQIRE